MKTVIHIGQHKTGTTSLQKCLHDNKNGLRDQRVFITNKILRHSNNSHYLLNIYALAENRFSSMKEKLLAAKSKRYIKRIIRKLPREIKKIYTKASKESCDTIIWSNEGLYLLNSKEEYLKLIDLFKPYSSEIIVICCFREKESYKASYVNQLKKQSIELSDDPDSYKYVKDDSWLFDYERKRSLLKEVFSECIFYDYQPQDNIKPFCDLLGLTLEGTSDIRANVTQKPV